MLQRLLVLTGRELFLRPLLVLADCVLRLLSVPGRCVRQKICEEDPLLRKPTVAIVGGSFAGLQAQRALSDAFDVTLIDLKDYFEYTPGVLRCFVEPSHLRSLTTPLPRRRNRLLLAEVLEVTPSAVRLRHSGASEEALLEFDFLLLGCGSCYPGPIKPSASEPTVETRRQCWEAAARQLSQAESVLVLGGGPVGVELAAEIAAAYPRGKRVTLLSRGGTLCGAMPARVGRTCARWLERRGVELIFGATVEKADDAPHGSQPSVTLSDGRVLRADVVYECTGGAPNSAMLRANAQLGGQLDAKGRLLVNDALQVAGAPRVYGLGDVMRHATSNEAKLGHTAELNAHLAADNVHRQSRGHELLRYPDGVVGGPHSPRIFCVSLGPYSGVVAFNALVVGGGVVSGALVALLKWLLEWTKVAACAERPVGLLFWRVADATSNWLTRSGIIPLPAATTEPAPAAGAP